MAEQPSVAPAKAEDTTRDGTSSANSGDASTRVEDVVMLRKRVSDLEGIINNTKSEKDRIARELEKTKTDLLGKLIDMQERKEVASPRRLFDPASVKKTLETAEDRDMAIAELLNSVGEQAERLATEKMTAAERRVQELLAKREEESVKASDFYRENKDAIELLVGEHGMTVSKAIGIVKQFKPVVEQPARISVTGGLGTASTSIGGDNIDNEKIAQVEKILGRKLTDAEKKNPKFRKG